jgi:pyruvate/2-oxoglutarate dehydrogenase complex dihydrolipoamide acyltransferase (E2) component
MGEGVEMKVEIAIPKLGMTMKEAKIARWNKKSGDRVEKGEVILVIETEKISYEIEAPSDGYLEIIEAEGSVVPVGAIVGAIHKARPEIQKEAPPPPPPPPRVPSPASSGEKRIKASPLARKIAREKGVDLSGVTGTGPGGRIVSRDVTAFVETREEALPEARAGLTYPERKVAKVIELSGMRKAIARNMHSSLMETAQMTLTSRVDATELARLRERLNVRYQAMGVSISYNAILVKMVATVLKDHPQLNATLSDQGIILWEDINVGVAMELEDGLIVPVVSNADKMTILEIERALRSLFDKARSRKLTPDEISGGTFTITNLGHLGIDAFTPILNRPESAILGVGRMREEPVILKHGGKEEIGFRQMMVLSLTVDHRIIDGAPAARFLKGLASLIEEPLLLLG